MSAVVDSDTRRTLVVTACDANHYGLATGLIASLNAISDRSFQIGFAQVGDVPVPAAIRDGVDVLVGVSAGTFKLQPGEGFMLAALAVKARLPELFPGYDIYVWLDGDIWIQNAAGLEEVVRDIDEVDICIAPQIDIHYHGCEFPDHYTLATYRGLFGDEVTERYVRRPMVNSGVFAARRDSPLWRRWSDLLFELRARIGERPGRFFSDQIPLHYLIFSGALTFAPLRTINNWLVSHAPVRFSHKARLTVPSPPFEEINIVHLIGSSKDLTFDFAGRQFGMTYQAIQDFKAFKAAQTP